MNVFAMMRRLPGKLVSAVQRLRQQTFGTITVERLQHMFDYSTRFNKVSLGRSGLGGMNKLGSSLSFSPLPYEVDMRRAAAPYRREEIIRNPPYLSWGWSPQFAYVGLVDGRIEYRYSPTQSAWHNAPVIRDAQHVALIDRMFDLWYEHLRLPASLLEPTETEQADALRAAVVGTGKLAFVRHYLATRDRTFLFSVLGEEEEIILWVDWRDEDDEIVRKAEAILQTGELSAEFAEVDDCIVLLITCRGATTQVSYPAGHADRGTTLSALERLLRPDYELRLCTASKGGDELAFLLLPAGTWADLEHEYPQAVAALFARFGSDTPPFGA